MILYLFISIDIFGGGVDKSLGKPKKKKKKQSQKKNPP